MLPLVYTLPLTVRAAWNQGTSQLEQKLMGDGGAAAASSSSSLDRALSRRVSTKSKNRMFALTFAVLCGVLLLRSTLTAYNYFHASIRYLALSFELLAALVLLLNLALTVRTVCAMRDLHRQ